VVAAPAGSLKYTVFVAVLVGCSSPVSLVACCLAWQVLLVCSEVFLYKAAHGFQFALFFVAPASFGCLACPEKTLSLALLQSRGAGAQYREG
jgi:hypothetical protein